MHTFPTVLWYLARICKYGQFESVWLPKVYIDLSDALLVQVTTQCFWGLCDRFRSIYSLGSHTLSQFSYLQIRAKYHKTVGNVCIIYRKLPGKNSNITAKKLTHLTYSAILVSHICLFLKRLGAETADVIPRDIVLDGRR